MKPLSIKDVAEKFNISKSKIRYYEEIGLIRSLRHVANNYRYFEEKELLKLTNILLYRELGFSIEAIKHMLLETSLEKHFYRQIKIIDDEIDDLKRIRDHLYSMVISDKVALEDVAIPWPKRLKSLLDYDEISKTYDDVRSGEEELVQTLVETATLNSTSKILDVGCGTGNYTVIVKTQTKGTVYGIDASKGMIKKAQLKSDDIIFNVAQAEDIPFGDAYFHMIYMTDVIHHIANLSLLFKELARVLKQQGWLCICTQSHRQIAKRYMSEFFPETMAVDKDRYPDVYDIIESAEEAGLIYVKTDIIQEDLEDILDLDFLNLVQNKGYSMLRMISKEAYQNGLESLKKLMSQGPISRRSAGWSLVWFSK